MLRRNAFRYSRRARIAMNIHSPVTRQARVAQPLPVEVQSPRLDEHEEQQRAQRLREPIHRDVDERLGAVLQVGRQRQKQHFARRLVDGVAQRRVEHARGRRRPERAVEQDDRRGRAEADRQNEQREGQAERAVDAAGQADLDDEADDREVERHLREEGRDGVGAAASLSRLGRHVELLLDDGGADRREADHQRDDLQVRATRAAAGWPRRRRRPVPRRPARNRSRLRSRRTMATTSADADAQHRRAHQQQIVGADLSTASEVSAAPIAPPRLAPPPMKPNSRLACRGS